ncbi:MAG: T9SS type A sorting domain-containing protein [Bacteroidota bacterium]
MRTLLLLLLCFGLATTSAAQTAASCEDGTARTTLSGANVETGLWIDGSIGLENATTPTYFVPRGTTQSPLFVASLWVGGQIGGETRTAAALYTAFEFWPGPLGDDAQPLGDCAQYDRIWSVSQDDVAAFEAGGAATADLRAWPTGLGAATVDATGAPVVPTSRGQVIDLDAGERPVVYGTQTAFWVMNDVGNEHVYTGSAPLGIEVQVTASAFDTGVAAFDNATVYRYRIVNRNTAPIEAGHASFWTDFDLGTFWDDYVGSDSLRHMAFVYNGQATDEEYGTPPAFGVDVLSGAASVIFPYKSGPFPTSESAQGPDEHYQFMQGRWRDGSPVTEQGFGFDTDGASVAWMYPGDPVAQDFWSLENIDGNGTEAAFGDMRGLANSPAFDLAPGDAYQFDVALLFAQGTDRLDSVAELRRASDRIQAAYDAGLLFGGGSPVSAEEAPQDRAFEVTVYPNPIRDHAAVAFQIETPSEVRVRVVDVLGRTVATIRRASVAAGVHRVSLPGDLASGTYVVEVATNRARMSRLVTVAR